MFYTKQIVTKQNLSIRAEDPNGHGREEPSGMVGGGGRRIKAMMTEITKWLRLSVKADALVAEPTRM